MNADYGDFRPEYCQTFSINRLVKRQMPKKVKQVQARYAVNISMKAWDIAKAGAAVKLKVRDRSGLEGDQNDRKERRFLPLFLQGTSKSPPHVVF